ncbi:MAG: sulfur carrier protein ThiS [Actinoplanes sp.]
MRLTVNGRPFSSEEALSVEGLVVSLTEVRRGVAVAVNGAVVPRSTWADALLVEGDVVEVLTAAQGG